MGRERAGGGWWVSGLLSPPKSHHEHVGAGFMSNGARTVETSNFSSTFSKEGWKGGKKGTFAWLDDGVELQEVRLGCDPTRDSTAELSEQGLGASDEE